MGKIKVSIGIKDKVFSEKLKRLSKYVEIMEETMSLEGMKRNTKKAELLFLDHIPTMGFSDLRAKVVVVGSRYSRRKEYLAARSGAKGFLTKDISITNLFKAIDGIHSGEIWMTRVVMAKVFEEYAKITKKIVPLKAQTKQSKRCSGWG